MKTAFFVVESQPKLTLNSSVALPSPPPTSPPWHVVDTTQVISGVRLTTSSTPTLMFPRSHSTAPSKRSSGAPPLAFEAFTEQQHTFSFPTAPWVRAKQRVRYHAGSVEKMKCSELFLGTRRYSMIRGGVGGLLVLVRWIYVLRMCWDEGGTRTDVFMRSP